MDKNAPVGIYFEGHAAPVPVEMGFKVGAHVRAPQLDLCGSIASVLRFPHQVGYGVLFDDCRPHDEMSSAVFGERDLVEVVSNV